MIAKFGSCSYGPALTTSDLRELRERYRYAGISFPSSNPRCGVKREGVVVTVYSYGIPVLAVRMTMQPAYMRLWDGWSKSTMNHISKMIGFSYSKADWLSMPVGEWVESDAQVTIWRG
jgi:hypothetical protein